MPQSFVELLNKKRDDLRSSLSRSFIRSLLVGRWLCGDGRLLAVIFHLASEQVCLRAAVAEVAGEEEHVAWLDPPCKPHEQARVEEHSRCHTFTNDVSWLIGVQDSRGNDAPISSWAPEMHCFWTDWRIDKRHNLVCHLD